MHPGVIVDFLMRKPARDVSSDEIWRESLLMLSQHILYALAILVPMVSPSAWEIKVRMFVHAPCLIGRYICFVLCCSVAHD